MGQSGPQGEQGPKGPKGDQGPSGVGIKFIKYDSTTGNLQISKTDDDTFSANIRGPPGPPGDYTADQVSSFLIKDAVFTNKLAREIAPSQTIANLVANNLQDNALFTSRLSANLSSSSNFITSIGGAVAANASFSENIGNKLGSIIGADYIDPIVSPKTIWCTKTGANNVCLLPTGGTLHLPIGANSEGVGGLPIHFYDNRGYKHFIRTRHHNVDGNGNAFDFYVNSSTNPDTSTAPGIGNKQIMSINGSGVDIGNLNATAGNFNNLKVGVGGRLRISSGSNDYTVIGSQDEGNDNTRIVVSGKTRPDHAGNIEYITSGGKHIFTGNITTSQKIGINNNDPIAPLSIGNATVDPSDGFISLSKRLGGTNRKARLGYNNNGHFVIGDWGHSNDSTHTWVNQLIINYDAPENSLVLTKDTVNISKPLNLGNGWTIETNTTGSLLFKKDNTVYNIADFVKHNDKLLLQNLGNNYHLARCNGCIGSGMHQDAQVYAHYSETKTDGNVQWVAKKLDNLK